MFFQLVNRGRRRRLLALSSICFSASLFAQQDSNPFEEIVVTPSLIPLPVSRVGASVEVLTSEQIQAHGNLSLMDILRQQSAVAATNTGGPGKTSVLRIRGEEGYRTLTIIDGMRIADPSAPQIAPLIEHVLSSDVGRVEILKGPQGLAFGADAGGVVNILSPAVQEPTGNVDLQGGKFGTRQASASYAGSSGRADYFLSATDNSTDGFNTQLADNVLADNDGYDNTTLHGRLGFAVSDDLYLSSVHRNIDAQSEYDSCFSTTVVHDCLSDYQLSATRIGLNYDAGTVNHALSYAVSSTERDNFAEGVLSFANEGELQRLEYTGSATELNGFDLVFGADWEDAEGDGNSRKNLGFYGEILSDFSESLHLSAGVRHDDNDDFGNNTSYRLSGAYLVPLGSGEILKLKGSYGTGFRAPSLFEIAYNRGSFAFPPASDTILRQEESTGWEMGLELASDSGAHFELVYFDQEIENAIFFDLASFSGYLQDVGTSFSEGVEASADIPLTSFLLARVNYTWNDTGRPNGLQRLRRPENLLNLGFDFNGMGDSLRLGVYYRSANDAIDEVFGSPTPLPDYEVIDISASFAITETIRIYGRLENANDERYEEVVGFNSAGRAFYAGLRIGF